MSLTITLELPPDVEEQLRAETPSLEADVKESYAIELFRRDRLTHYELSQVLGLDRFETDALLKRHHVIEGTLTMEDLEADRKTLEGLLGRAR